MRTYITQEEETIRTRSGIIDNTYQQEHSIRDWNIDYPVEYIRWSPGEPIPTSKSFVIILPDLEKLPKNKQYESFSYEVYLTNDEFVKCEGNNTALSGNITELDEGRLLLRLSFSNFEALPSGQTTTVLFIDYYGRIGSSRPTKLESRAMRVILNNAIESEWAIHGQQSAYEVTYNLNDCNFYPSLDIALSVDNLSPQLFQSEIKRIPQPYGPPKYETTKASHFIINSQSTIKGSPVSIHFSPSENNPFVLSAVGFFDDNNNDIKEIEEKEEYFLTSFQIRRNDEHGFLSPFVLAQTLPLVITVRATREKSYFRLLKNNFRFETTEDSPELLSDSVQIDNPFNIRFKISNSSLVTVATEYVDKKCNLAFTINTSELLPGFYHASISVSNDYQEKIILIELWVRPHTQFVPEEVYFCADCGALDVYRSHKDSEYVVMTIDMKFSGYGIFQKKVTQKYENVFFDNHLQFYPGEDIQDFFPELKKLDFLQESKNTIIPTPTYSAALVHITIEERNATEVFDTKSYSPLFFLPGYRPLAYPYLTNSLVRTSYSESIIVLSALSIDIIKEQLHLIATNKIDNTLMGVDTNVVSMFFSRRLADSVYGEQKILSHKGLFIEPKPNSSDIIHSIFPNSNYCPEWFSFSGEYEEYKELKHILSESKCNKIGRKVKTESKPLLKLNTGWIFEEEIPILDELLEADLCFLQLHGKWIVATAISKKTMNQDNLQNLNNMIVEFEILHDER